MHGCVASIASVADDPKRS